MNTVVPFAVELVWRELDRGQFSIADFDPFGIRPLIQRRLDFQPALGLGRPNELNDHLVTHEWPPAPVLRDVTEHSMFDLVPLARPRGEVTHADLKSQFIRQALQLHLPQSHSAAIATPAIRGDQQLAGVSIDRLTHLSPPP